MKTLKLYDIITQQYFENLASGTLYGNGKLAQDIQLLDADGNPINLNMDGSGNVGVNVNGVTLVIEGDVTIDKIKLLNQALAEINPATLEAQEVIGNLIYDNHNALIQNLSSILKTSQQKQLMLFAQQYNTPIAANGGYNNVIADPGVGFLARLNHLFISVPPVPNASSGTHSLTISLNNSGDTRLFKFTSNYNSPIYLYGSNLVSGTVEGTATPESIASTLRELIFNHNYQLNMYYENNTNQAQTSTRYYRVYYLKELETAF